MCNNTTAIFCENKIRTSHDMNNHCQTVRTWEKAIKYDNHLIAPHILEKNTTEDKKLRFNYIETERILPGYLNQSLNL